VSTTGIKCVGNSVVLHGVPYSPPYAISAIGNPSTMLDSVNADAYLQLYLQAVDKYDLGWDVKLEPDLSFKGYDGPTELQYAKPAAS
jgi:uncharacterized protein YlxW (UPF0749 family)